MVSRLRGDASYCDSGARAGTGGIDSGGGLPRVSRARAEGGTGRLGEPKALITMIRAPAAQQASFLDSEPSEDDVP